MGRLTPVNNPLRSHCSSKLYFKGTKVSHMLRLELLLRLQFSEHPSSLSFPSSHLPCQDKREYSRQLHCQHNLKEEPCWIQSNVQCPFHNGFKPCVDCSIPFLVLCFLFQLKRRNLSSCLPCCLASNSFTSRSWVNSKREEEQSRKVKHEIVYYLTDQCKGLTDLPRLKPLNKTDPWLHLLRKV